jgi:8-oxo-dGTP diphosphatase
MPAAYVVLRRGNEILLQLRANTGYQDGNYGLVSGHVEAGETYTQAMIREAKEEAGITLVPEHLFVAHVMHRKDEGVDNERADIFFVATKWEGEITNMEPNKCAGLDWFGIENLPQNIVPYIKEAILHIKNQTFYSEYGWE